MGLMSVMADIWRSRSRSALTMSAVAIGIFSVTVISAAGQIGTAKINDSLYLWRHRRRELLWATAI